MLTYRNTESTVRVKHFLYYNMSAKKVMGRPRLPPEEKRKVFPLRFNEAELSLFTSAAKAKKLPLREWMTSTLTEAARIS